MSKIIDVRKIVENEKNILLDKVNNLKEKGINPKLVVIVANDDSASKSYVKSKTNLCDKMGIECENIYFERGTTYEEISNKIKKLNADNSVHGILLQLPVFDYIGKEKEKNLIESIDVKKDVDGFTSYNLGKLLKNDETICPCTPKGIITILESIGETFKGKNAVVIGRSEIVGRPIAQMLTNRDATVTICHSKTKDLSEYTKKADILVVAVGKPKIITKDMVKDGAIVIDVGINRVNGKIIGDVDTDRVSEIANTTPVPGGVGLTTVLSVGKNLIKLIENKK